MSEVPDHLTFDDAAARLGYSLRQLQRWEESGKLQTVPGKRTVTREQAARLIPRSEFERLLKEKDEGQETAEA